MINKNKKLIENYIKVILNETGILGKYVWPSAIKGHDFPDDPDTEVEEQLYKELYNHFAGKEPLSDKSVNIIKTILDLGEYPDIFKRCDESHQALRGLRLPVSWLEKYAPEALQDLPDKTDILDWKDPVKIKPIVFRPDGKYGNVSSWTGAWEKARRFTRMWSANTVPVILYSDCSSGYFMQTWPFTRFKGGRYEEEFGIPELLPYKHEREIMLFGDCIVTHVQVNATQKEINKLRAKAISNV